LTGQLPPQATPASSSEDTAAPSRQLTRLLYYFWLPAGKDEFGFSAYEDAPLSKTAFYRSGTLEQTISDNLGDRADRLQGIEPSLGGVTWTGNLEAHDADDLGLRKIEYEFSYERGTRSLPSTPSGPIKGNALLLSNGLYLWSFELWHDGKNVDNLREEAKTFLVEDFIPRHVARLFNFGWTSSVPGGLDAYDGIMTFYQMDILFNGLFDINAHPHVFLPEQAPPQLNGVYTVKNIIRSASLASLGKSHFPLFDKRKDFSLRGNPVDACYIDTNIDLFSTTHSEQIPREQLLSRISFAAMEQFLRVAISFGLVHYKAGLDHCRAQLVDLGLLRDLNRSSRELQRPSLPRDDIRLSKLESYHSILASKLPIVAFLHDLVEDLTAVSRPLDAPEGRKRDATNMIADPWVEWLYSRSTLDEALAQFERQVNVIRGDILAIDRSLDSARMALTLAELTEARKLAEVEAETPRQIIVQSSPEQDRELTKKLGLLALILGLMEAYGNFGVFLTQSFFQGKFYGDNISMWYKVFGWLHWLLVVALLALIYIYFLRGRGRLRLAEPESDESHQGRQSYVFDYGSLRDKVDVPGGAEEAVRQLAKNLRALDSNRTVACAGQSIFRETPTMGVERTKYSLESAKNDSGLSYVLHVEVDRRWSDSEEQLRDIRLVVQGPQSDLNVTEITEGAKELIEWCIKALGVVENNDTAVETYTKTRFGW
jgi:hypothetical protein